MDFSGMIDQCNTKKKKLKLLAYLVDKVDNIWLIISIGMILLVGRITRKLFFCLIIREKVISHNYMSRRLFFNKHDVSGLSSSHCLRAYDFIFYFDIYFVMVAYTISFKV